MTVASDQFWEQEKGSHQLAGWIRQAAQLQNVREYHSVQVLSVLTAAGTHTDSARSGKMLQSPNYAASVEAGELVPQITLNKFSSEEEEWSWWEKLQIFYKMLRMDEFGNNNPALWRIGPQEDGVYLAVTDAKVATRWQQRYIPQYCLGC